MLGKFSRLNDLGKHIVRKAFPHFRGRTVYAKRAETDEKGGCKCYVQNWWDGGCRDCACVISSNGLKPYYPRGGHPGFGGESPYVEFNGEDVLVMHVTHGMRQYVRIVATEAVLSALGEYRWL